MPVNLSQRAAPAALNLGVRIRLRLATIAGDAAAAISRLTRKGSGASIRGQILTRLCPDAFKQLLQGRRILAVSGTNGKTTSTHLLTAALREALGADAARIVTNADGANLHYGIASALSQQRTADIAVLETDERVVRDMIAFGNPEVLVFLNFSRDQLDRHHEIKSLGKSWREALQKAGTNGPVVVANANDPLVVWSSQTASKVIWVDTALLWSSDAVLCPECGAILVRQQPSEAAGTDLSAADDAIPVTDSAHSIDSAHTADYMHSDAMGSADATHSNTMRSADSARSTGSTHSTGFMRSDATCSADAVHPGTTYIHSDAMHATDSECSMNTAHFDATHATDPGSSTNVTHPADAAARWDCPNCELTQPKAEYHVSGKEIIGPDGTCVTPNLQVPGAFNISNAALALAAAACFGVDTTTALRGMQRVVAPAGRFATATFRDNQARLLLAKNPAGWAEALPLLTSDPAVLAIDSVAADGKDVSWLWDVNFEELAGRKIICTGPRAQDLAVRLSYAGVDHCVVPQLLEAISAATTATSDATTVDVIATYTPFQYLLKAAKLR